MTRENWDDYDSVGEVRAFKLNREVGSPSEFVEACESKHDDVPTYASLELPVLRDVTDIGHEVASQIIDQMVNDLNAGGSRE